jgi:hypothetical protein
MCLLTSYVKLSQIDKLELKTIRILFPLHRDALTAYLSPILGQYAIKNNEFIAAFIENFHVVTQGVFKSVLNVEGAEAGGSLYNEEVAIPLIVHIYKGGKFIMEVNTPTIGFLFSTCFKKRRRFYRYLINKKLAGLRNYKKLIQISFFKLDGRAKKNTDIFNTPISNILLKQYTGVRNALHQRR